MPVMGRQHLPAAGPEMGWEPTQATLEAAGHIFLSYRPFLYRGDVDMLLRAELRECET